MPRNRRIVEMVEPASEPERWTPILEGPDTEEDTYHIVFRAGLRMTVRMTFTSERLHDFALILETFVSQAWWQVVRADCGHGHVHLDHVDRSGDTVRTQQLREISFDRT
jgi:hypothetical protein